jgi:heterodisulfide reductase subunit A-like polyferredoxin
MAIVPNLDGQGIRANGHRTGPVDVSYCVPTTSAAGFPAGASLFAGQIQVDSANGNLYRNLSSGTTTWVEVN